jgi:L-threonine kinase
LQVTVKVPGSCGELIQGMMGEVNFLVTCPVNCYSLVSIKKNNSGNISVNVSGKIKLLSAVRETIKMYNLDNESGYEIILESDLPIGKGMASSTADMTAAIIATGIINNKYLSENEIAKILLKIEPSDGIFYQGVVAFDHIHGSYYEKVGDAFKANFLIYDYGGEVDTIRFNSDPDLKKKNIEKIPVIEKAYFMIKESFVNKDIKKLGEAITLSSWNCSKND